MGNVEPLTFALVKSDGKEFGVTLVYPCQVAITDFVKMQWNVIVKMVGRVLTATYVSILIVTVFTIGHTGHTKSISSFS